MTNARRHTHVFETGLLQATEQLSVRQDYGECQEPNGIAANSAKRKWYQLVFSIELQRQQFF